MRLDASESTCVPASHTGTTALLVGSCAPITSRPTPKRPRLVGVAYLLELLGVAALVRVVRHRQLVVRLLDLAGRAVGLHAERLVHLGLLGCGSRRVLGLLLFVDGIARLLVQLLLLLLLRRNRREVDGLLAVQVVVLNNRCEACEHAVRRQCRTGCWFE